MIVPHPSFRVPLLLFCVLLSVNLLAYVAAPASADGEALLATAATLVRHGSPDIMVMGASEALLPEAGRMGQFGHDGLLYPKKGPTPSLLLLPLAAAAEALPWLSMRATAMLFNPLITALTAVVVYGLIRRLAYRQLTAFLAALLFGVATFALSYVKTLFGEPLAGLLLLSSVYAAHAYREQRAARCLWLAGGALGLALGVNLSYGGMVPIIGLYLFGWNPRAWRLRDVARLAIPILVSVLLLGGYNWMRFGSPLESGYHFAAGEGFNRPFFYGVYGLLLSPYKGLFWYNAVLLLAIPGWLMLRRRWPRLALTVLALAAVQVAAYASWWSWHGGVAWGPRFLLPVTPLLAVCLAPVLEAALRRPLPWLRVTVVLLVGLSVGIQLLGVLYSYNPYYGYLLQHYGSGTLDGIVSGLDARVMTDPASSPLIGQAALAVAGWDFEPAVLSGSLDGWHLIAALLPMLAGLAALSGRIGARGAATLAGLAVLVSLNLVAARQARGAEHAAVRAFEQTLQPASTTLAATTLFGDALLDVEGGGRILTVNAPSSPADRLGGNIWRYALEHNQWLWYVSWFPPGDADNWQERALWERYAFVAERPLAGHRADLFFLGAPPDVARPGGWQFGPVRLGGYGVAVDRAKLLLTLAWEAAEKTEHDYTWFVHLIDGDGKIVAQQDRAPQGGYQPTSRWQVGIPVRDMLCLPVPAGTNVAGWQVRVGFIDPATQERLPARLPDGTLLPDGYALLPLAP